MAKRKKFDAPKLPSTGGRPAIDWALLFDLWVVGQTPKRDFLLQYGLSTTSGTVRANTKHWTQAAKAGERDAAKIRLEQRTQEEKERVTKKDGPQGVWEFVMQCRQGQALDDWKTAQAVRSHIKMLLQSNVHVREGSDPTTTLTARGLKDISEALERVQKVQRLALGMSTDNIGVSNPGQGDNDPNVENLGDGSCPVFVVEVNDQGKFKRARPRQVR